MSAVGTILFQSPGWNKGKARYETLGPHRQKQNELLQGAALTELVLAVRCGCAAPTGLNKCVPMINPGLAPWAMKKCRPCRAHLRYHHQSVLILLLLQGSALLRSKSKRRCKNYSCTDFLSILILYSRERYVIFLSLLLRKWSDREMS